MLINKGQCSEFAAKTLEGKSIASNEDLDILENDVENYISTRKWLPYDLDEHEIISHDNFLKLINGYYLGLVYQDQNDFDEHYFRLRKANYDTETFVPDFALFYECDPSSLTIREIQFSGGPNGTLEYEDDSSYIIKQLVEHNIVCHKASGLPYITLRIISDGTTPINSIAKLASALYSNGYTTIEKACSASGDYGVTDESAPVMGVFSNDGVNVTMVGTNSAHTNISNFSMSNSVSIYDNNMRYLTMD